MPCDLLQVRSRLPFFENFIVTTNHLAKESGIIRRASRFRQQCIYDYSDQIVLKASEQKADRNQQIFKHMVELGASLYQSRHHHELVHAITDQTRWES